MRQPVQAGSFEDEAVGPSVEWQPALDIYEARRNERDLTDVPAEVRERLQWRLVDRVDQVLEVVLRPRQEAAPALA